MRGDPCPGPRGMVAEDWRFQELLRRAAEHQAHQQAATRPERQRILFLGNSYNSFSASCLQALVELGHDTFVGLYDPLTRGAWRVLWERAESRGWGFVLRKTVDLVRCKARLGVRRVGIPLSKFAAPLEVCRAYGLKVISCPNPNSPEFVERVRALRVDLIIVAAFGRILKPVLISIPRLGCVNMHPSLLPRYRGPDPSYWLLANREKITGVTIHYIEEGIDCGEIILQREFEIRPEETELTLGDRSCRVAAELLREAIPLLVAGRAPRIRQDDSAASYYSFPPKRPSVLWKLRTRFRRH